MTNGFSIFEKIKTRIILMLVIFEIFMFGAIALTFYTFYKLEGDAFHINTIGNQRERLLEIQFHILSYITSADDEFKKDAYKDISIFEYNYEVLTGKKKSTALYKSSKEKGVENKSILAQMESGIHIWDEYKTEVRNAITLQQDVIKKKHKTNLKMTATVSAFRSLSKRIGELEGEDYEYYDEFLEKLRSKIIRAFIYLDEYTFARNDDLVKENLINIKVNLNKAASFLEGMKYGSDKLDIFPIEEGDEVTLELLRELKEKFEEYQDSVYAAVDVRDAIMASIRNMQKLAHSYLKELNIVGEMLQINSERKISTKLYVDLILLFVALVNLMVFILLLAKIKKIVGEMEQKVFARTKEVHDILDRMGEGLLTISDKLTVNPDYSSISSSIFEQKNLAGATLSNLLFQDAIKVQKYEGWLKELFQPRGNKAVEEILSMADKEIEMQVADKVKRLHFEYWPIYDEGKGSLQKVMLILKDITEVRNLEEKGAKDKNEFLKTVRILRNMDSFFTFLHDSRSIILETEETLEKLGEREKNLVEIMDKVFKDIKQVQGTAAVFSLEEFSAKADRFEEHLLHLKNHSKELTPALVGDVQKQIHTLYEELNGVVSGLTSSIGENFGSGCKVIKVKEDKFLHFLDVLKKADISEPVRESLLKEVCDLARVPIGRALLMFSEMHLGEYEAAGKRISPIVVSGGDMEIEGELVGLLQTVVMHSVRNAIEHGVESSEERLRNKKEEYATISIDCSKDNGAYIINVKDNGRGINLSGIKKSAVAAGCVIEDEAHSLSEQDVLALTLKKGVSWTQGGGASGEGFGLSIVNGELLKNGGSVRVSAVSGQGTNITLTIKTPESGIYFNG